MSTKLLIALLGFGVAGAIFAQEATVTASRQPTRDDLAEITTIYGGQANIALVAQHRKINLVLSTADAMDSIHSELDEADMRVIAAFRASGPEGRRADGEMATRMWAELCNSIEDLDAVSIARKVAEMDAAVDAAGDSRARDFLDRLSPRGRSAMLRAGDEVAPLLKGEKIDVVELARRFPEHSKSLAVGACARMRVQGTSEWPNLADRRGDP